MGVTLPIPPEDPCAQDSTTSMFFTSFFSSCSRIKNIIIPNEFRFLGSGLEKAVVKIATRSRGQVFTWRS